MILYTQSFIVRVQQKPARRFTCVKVHTVTLSKILSCYSAFDKKTRLCSRRCLPMLCLCYAHTEYRACAVSGFAKSPCTDPVLKTRARKVSWLWYTPCTSLGARWRTREKTSGTQGLVGDAWGVELITACVVAYPGASRHF